MRIEIKTTLPNTPTAELNGLITRGVKAVELDANGRLIFTLTDNSIADLGGIPMLTDQSVAYQNGASGTTAPTGDWSDSIPETAQGQYLWTRTVLSFNDSTAVTAYSVSRMGLDGSGSVISVNGESPDEDGNVSLSAADVGAAETSHGHELSDVTGLSDALSGKAAASHDHELSDVTGLSNALSEKAAASHSHTPADVGAIPSAEKGAANGVATLDENGKLDVDQASSKLVAKGESFTLSPDDSGKFIRITSNTDMVITVPNNSDVPMPNGTEIEFCQWEPVTITFVAASGTSLVSLGGSRTLAGQYACAALKKTTTNSWVLSGALA